MKNLLIVLIPILKMKRFEMIESFLRVIRLKFVQFVPSCNSSSIRSIRTLIMKLFLFFLLLFGSSASFAQSPISEASIATTGLVGTRYNLPFWMTHPPPDSYREVIGIKSLEYSYFLSKFDQK